MVENNIKPVAGYMGYYAVSPEGEVYSQERVIELPDGRNRRVKGRVLRQKDNGTGYKFVVLSKNGKKQSCFIHRLVAGAFIENPHNLPQVNHIDGQPGNNSVENLEFVSHRQNVQYGYDTGLNRNQGGTHGFSVGVIDNEIGMRFESVKEWSAARNINYNTARNILNGYSSVKSVNPTLVIKLNRKVYEKNDSTE